MKLNWREATGYGLIVIASCFWGGAASLGKTLMQNGISTIQLMQIRSVISAVLIWLLLLALARQHLRIQLRDLPAFLLLSLPGLALVNASYYYAIKMMPVAIAVFIQFTAPLLIFLYGWASGKERATKAKFLALLMCIGGTYLMVQIQSTNLSRLPWLALASAFVSMLSYGFYVIVSHHLGKKHSSWTIIAYSYGIVSIFWSIVQNSAETYHAVADRNLWFPALMFALFSTLIPFSIFLLGLRRVTPTGAGIASTSETIAASLVAFLFLGETLAPLQIMGAALILVSLLLLLYHSESEPPEPVN